MRPLSESKKIPLLDHVNLGKKRKRKKHFSVLKSSSKRIISSFNNPKSEGIRVTDFSSTTYFFAAMVLIVFLIFVAKAFQLQIVKGDEYLKLSDMNRTKNFTLQAERGVIYDRFQQVIARNKPAFSLVMDTRRCVLKNEQNSCLNSVYALDEVLVGLGSSELDKDLIKKSLEENHPNIVLADGLSKDEIVLLEPRISEFSDVKIVTSPRRDYLYPKSCAHLIGYVGLSEESLYPEIEGKTGLEEYYDEFLSGLNGKEILQRNAEGTSGEQIAIQEPVPGSNIELFLDLGLQNLAYDLLEKEVANDDPDHPAIAGAVIASDPKTGGILTLVNYPSFDPNLMVSGISSEELASLSSDPLFPFFNRAISGAYPPGSTFKMITASAALSEKVITPQYIINDPGFIQIGAYTFRNWKLDGHGPVDMRRAIEVSNDTYFYTVGGGHNGIEGLGISRLSKWAERLGLNESSKIDLNGENAGHMPDGSRGEWYLGDDYITAIGQGDVLATPLQINNLTSYFANSGVTYKPQIVKKINGDSVYSPQPLFEDLIGDDVLEVVRDGLHRASGPSGTAYAFISFPDVYGIEVAGKTGTSEYITPDGKESTHAWFTVFAPYEDPEIVLTVFLEGGGGGSTAAVPIARELLDFWFQDFKL